MQGLPGYLFVLKLKMKTWFDEVKEEI